MISVRLDGELLSFPEGTTLGRILSGRDPECVVALVRPGGREAARTENLRLTTTAGEVVVEVPGGTVFPELPVGALGLLWEDRYAAAFGPFPGGITPARKPSLYERSDVILGCGGYDPERSFLVFSRMRHSADHGAESGGGVIGRVVVGRGVIDRWTSGDRITGISPVLSWADTTRSFTSRDPDIPLEDGMEMVTWVEIDAQGFSGNMVNTGTARSVEHLLFSLRQGRFLVSSGASTHILDERWSGRDVVSERAGMRREGTVTVRTKGRLRGAIYIYTSDIPAGPAHTIVGQVVHGIEIARLARVGDLFSVRINPERFDMIGMPLTKALEICRGRAIRVSQEQEGDDLVVIGQEPGTTLEVLSLGNVTLTTIPFSHVVDITLDDRSAPDSCAIFRELTGLSTHSVGKMPLFFSFEDVFLFRPDVPPGIRITPENTPMELVEGGALAMTNDARKGAGLVGIRLNPNREFGPTSEPFEGTNIIGRVIDLEKLHRFSENEMVYIREGGG
jgi:putative methanogenesis marker protein 3